VVEEADMPDGEQVDRRRRLTFYLVQEILTCPNGHTFPALAAVCPVELPDVDLPMAAGAVQAEILSMAGADSYPPPLQQFLDHVVVWKDNGKPPRSNYGHTKWNNAKAGTCNHRPVCSTLKQLTDYFCGGASAGSTHFGIGKHETYELEVPESSIAFPVAETHQYMAVSSPYSPWAQGIITWSSSCPIPESAVVHDMASGEPNCAYISIENVEDNDPSWLSDGQFNSNVMIRAWGRLTYGHAIDPITQIWHAEVDPVSRCADPGWPGSEEDAMQAAANAVCDGDFTWLRGLRQLSPPEPPDPEPEPEPEPEPPVPTDYQARYYDELRGQHAAYHDDEMRAAVRLERVEGVMADEGIDP
jgi:hypothetical protein